MISKPKARRPVQAGVIDGTEMRVLQIGEDPQRKQRCVGTVAMVTRDFVDTPTAISMMQMDLSFLGPGEYIQRYIVQGNVLVFQRNECINRMDGDWILFVDSDMTWQPGDLKTLVDTQAKFDLDIVSGLCFQRGEPFQPTLYVRAPEAEHGYTFMEHWPEDAAVEVDATGMAFTLIHQRVFERIITRAIKADIGRLELEGGDLEALETLNERLLMPFPPLVIRQDLIPIPFFRWDGEYGEDFAFCREAQAAGNHIFVDTAVKVGHVGSHVVTEETFLREIAFRDEKSQAFREQQLSDVGRVAMTPAEARQKLGVTWK